MQPQKEGETEIVIECISCEVKNCIVCNKNADQIANNSFTSCLICKNGYTKVGDECQECSSTCMHCQENTKSCIYCKQGFQMDITTNQCVEIQIPNCVYQRNSTFCDACEGGFYNFRGECRYCESNIANCNYCIMQSEKSNEQQCTSCRRGFVFDNQKCQECPNHCDSCSEDQCLECKKGYYLSPEKNRCIKCTVDYCEYCESSGICRVCKEGHFLKYITRTCEK